MAKSATIRARLDPQLKEEAEGILQELGISTTQALTLFYQQIRLKKGIPFEIRLPDERTEQNGGSHVADESILYPVDANRSVMEQNIEAYNAMHEDLVKHYLGQYVAICDGSLVDHDVDPVVLLQRVRSNHPQQVILRQKVNPTGMPRELRLRRPQIEPLT